MITFINLIIISILFIYLNYICLKYNFFIDNIANSNHKKFILQKKKIPITGGLYLFFGYFSSRSYIYDLSEIYYFSFIIVLGYLSDYYKSFSSWIRLLLQVLICLAFVLHFDLIINDVRIDKVNAILSYPILGYFFVVFCLVISINGSNFIDGVNLLSIGYYLMILFCLLILSTTNDLIINKELIIVLIILLVVLFFFNTLSRVFLGDGGIYFLSFIVSVLLIKFNNDNPKVSPYYIICLLWYPCFENLFSIVRKKLSKQKALKPDNMHLHHLIYSSQKFTKLKNTSSNMAGLIILLFNLPVFVLSTYHYNYTKYLLIVIAVSVFLYVLFYFAVKKFF